MAKNDKSKHYYTNIYVKRRLMKLEIDIFGIIGNGLATRVPRSKLVSRLRDEVRSLAVHIQLSDQERNQLWTQTYKQFLLMSKANALPLRREKDTEKRKQLIYDSIRARIQDGSLIKDVNSVMYSYEFRAKHDHLYGPEGLIAIAREAASDPNRAYSPFWICSSHKNPAKDHAPYQGKVYYDEDYERYASDGDSDRIRAYIRNRKLISIQKITGAPVFLTTRRNCKHFFKHLELEEVLHSSSRSLLKRHKMVIDGDKPASEPLLYYRQYYNRLKLETALYEAIPNPKLKQDINNDKKLLEKWKKML